MKQLFFVPLLFFYANLWSQNCYPSLDRYYNSIDTTLLDSVIKVDVLELVDSLMYDSILSCIEQSEKKYIPFLDNSEGVFFRIYFCKNFYYRHIDRCHYYDVVIAPYDNSYLKELHSSVQWHNRSCTPNDPDRRKIEGVFYVKEYLFVAETRYAFSDTDIQKYFKHTGKKIKLMIYKDDWLKNSDMIRPYNFRCVMYTVETEKRYDFY